MDWIVQCEGAISICTTVLYTEEYLRIVFWRGIFRLCASLACDVPKQNHIFASDIGTAAPSVLPTKKLWQLVFLILPATQPGRAKLSINQSNLFFALNNTTGEIEEQECVNSTLTPASKITPRTRLLSSRSTLLFSNKTKPKLDRRSRHLRLFPWEFRPCFNFLK